MIASTHLKGEKLYDVGPAHVDIAFERFGDPSSPPVLLIMGGGAQMIAWPDGFCEALMNCGLHLVRFDNRDTGLSTHFTGTPDFQAVISGDFTTVSYTLSDMAADIAGFMDRLEFSQMHIIGASMGGMIAQTMAIEHPDRVASLTSIMSTTGAPSVGQTDFGMLSALGAPPYHDRELYVAWRVKSMKVLNSTTFPFDEVAAYATAALSWDRDHDPLGMLRQSVAVIKSGDRTEKLKHLKVPTRVIHGTADKMIDISGGQATAAAISNATLHTFEGMGHTLPKPLWSHLAKLMASHILENPIGTVISLG